MVTFQCIGNFLHVALLKTCSLQELRHPSNNRSLIKALHLTVRRRPCIVCFTWKFWTFAIKSTAKKQMPSMRMGGWSALAHGWIVNIALFTTAVPLCLWWPRTPMHLRTAGFPPVRSINGCFCDPKATIHKRLLDWREVPARQSIIQCNLSFQCVLCNLVHFRGDVHSNEKEHHCKN